MIANSSDLGELIKKVRAASYVTSVSHARAAHAPPSPAPPAQMQAISGVGQTTGSGGGGGNESAPEGGATQSARGAKGTGSDKVEAAQEALRQAFAQRGCDTLLRLGKKFKIMDDDGSKGVSYEEVRAACCATCPGDSGALQRRRSDSPPSPECLLNPNSIERTTGVLAIAASLQAAHAPAAGKHTR